MIKTMARRMSPTRPRVIRGPSIRRSPAEKSAREAPRNAAPRGVKLIRRVCLLDPPGARNGKDNSLRSGFLDPIQKRSPRDDLAAGF